jgi:Ribonucleotide reductase alpha domain/LAGLIDADG-like domain/Intein splicing domain
MSGPTNIARAGGWASRKSKADAVNPAKTFIPGIHLYAKERADAGVSRERDDEFYYLGFRLTDEFIKPYKRRSFKWGFPVGGNVTLGEITWLTKYSARKLDGTKEKFWEGLRRVIEGMYSIQREHAMHYRLPWSDEMAQTSAQEAYERCFAGKWSPPGRGFWKMGTFFVNGLGDSSALQNCAFLSTESIGDDDPAFPFYRLMEMSMLGVGVGFDVKGAGALKLRQPIENDDPPIVVDDSREGWYGSTRTLLESYFVPRMRAVKFDYSEVRPQGEPIKGFGGHAAGPEPLIQLHRRLRTLLSYRQGEKITSTDIVDICNVIGKCLPGDVWVLTADGPRQVRDLVGVPTDLIVNGKSYKSSGFFQTGEKPIVELVTEQGHTLRMTADHQILTRQKGDQTWVTAGELVPGDAVVLHVHKDMTWGGEGTEAEGYLLGHLVGDGSIRKVAWGTGELALLMRWEQDAGSEVVGKHIEDILDGYPKRADAKGFRPNGGPGRLMLQRTAVTRLATAYDIQRGNKTITSKVEQASSDFSIGFLRGLFDTDGHVDPNARRVSLAQSSELLLKAAQRMLGRLGILSSVTGPSRGTEWSLGMCGRNAQRFMEIVGFVNPVKTASYYSIPWVRGPYSLTSVATVRSVLATGEVEPVYDVTVDEVHAFDANGFYVHNCVVAANVRSSAEIALGDPNDEAYVNLKNPLVNPDRMGFVRGPDGLPATNGDGSWLESEEGGWGYTSNNSVLAKVGESYHNIGDRIAENGEPGLVWLEVCRAFGRLADPPNHKDERVMGTNPCGEQPLEHNELCTLVEVYPTNCTNKEDYLRTLKFAYLYGKTVTLLPTHWTETNKVMVRNRRIGTSMSGLAMFVEAKGWAELRTWQDDGYKEIKRWDNIYSEWLGIRESVKVTTVKPSGTVSLLFGVTPGAHWPTERSRYLRRMRLTVNDPIALAMEKAGFPVEPNQQNPQFGVVVTCPTKGPDIPSEREVSVYLKVLLALQCQEWWSDNSVSLTASFLKEAEGAQIAPLLQACDGKLKSISFLPLSDDTTPFAQMPYQRVPDTEWQAMWSQIGHLDWASLYAGEAGDAEGELFCTTDSCELVAA